MPHRLGDRLSILNVVKAEGGRPTRQARGRARWQEGVWVSRVQFMLLICNVVQLSYFDITKDPDTVLSKIQL